MSILVAFLHVPFIPSGPLAYRMLKLMLNMCLLSLVISELLQSHPEIRFTNIIGCLSPIKLTLKFIIRVSIAVMEAMHVNPEISTPHLSRLTTLNLLCDEKASDWSSLECILP